MNQSGTILVADDDRSIRTVVSQALTRAGFDVLATGTASGLWHWVENGQGDAIITDVVLPDADGLDLLPKIRKLRPELPVIVMSAQNTLETAVKAAERGAYEYLPKPFDIDELTETVSRALTKRRALGEAATTASLGEKAPLVGRSPAMQQVYKVMARVMATDLTVLIQGESGTGKELVARALHDMGPRREAPFVAVNMAAIPRELIESELFGHEKGAFTGAGQRAPGRFAQANKGTLFLDEIGDMPLEAQTRLLRVLQEGEYRPVGGRSSVKVDIRIVAASNRKLKALVREGSFREDLFYRLNVVPLALPPLRERTSDIDDLVERFLGEAEAEGLPPKQLDPGALKILRAHSWPGNVRELENLVRRLCVLHTEEIITAAIITEALAEDEVGDDDGGGLGGGGLADAAHAHLARYFAAHAGSLPPAGLYSRVLREIETPLIELTLAATKGNQVKAAAILGLNRNTLRKKISELGINLS